jgi:putative methyltransferase
LEWFAEHNIPYLDGTNANFGIFKERDTEIAVYLTEVMKRRNWQTTFRQSWAKNATDRFIHIAKILHDAGALSAVGLALESMDPVTLKTIERANIKFSSFSELTKTFREQKLPTYTELIRALPGETLESFTDGLRQLVENSDIQTVYIYNCAVLPNAELAHPAYRAKHKIETIRSPIFLAHSGVSNRDQLAEMEELVVSTATASQADVERMHLLSWMVTVFHSFGLLKYAMQKSGTTNPMEFYQHVMDNPTPFLAQELAIVKAHIEKGFAGKGWDHVDPEWGDIVWPIEEASWLRLTDSGAFRSELSTLLETAGIPWPQSGTLAGQQIAHWTIRKPYEDKFEFAKRVIWHGRRKGAFLRESVRGSDC